MKQDNKTKGVYSVYAQHRREKTQMTLIAALSVAFNIGFFSPMDFYLNNIVDVTLPYKIVLLACAPVAIVLFIAVFLTLKLTKGKAHIAALSLTVGINLATYIQGNFMTIGMATLDGSAYSVSFIRATVDILLWCVLLVMPFFIYIKANDLFRGMVILISTAVILIELVAIITDVIGLIGKEYTWRMMMSEKHYLESCKVTDEFTYSTKKNHIVFIVDQYDSFVFDNAVSREPESVSGFDGFTYYNNTVGMYKYTDKSMAYLFTNRLIENEDALGDQYKSDNLFRHIPEDYKVEFYCDSNLLPKEVMRNEAENVEEHSISFNDVTNITSAMFKMVMYRISPDVSKGLFWSYTGDFINSLSSVKTYLSDNQVFYRSLPDEIKYTDEPCYKLFYLKGIHAPRTTDQNIERVEDGKVIPTDCAIGVNKVLSEYFELLKKGGVYDNSDIIVLADHGQRPNYGGKFPLFMIKLAGDTQEGIRTSSVPVSYADFYSTCLFLLGDESSKSTSVFALSEGEKRERYFAESDEYITEDVDRTLPLIENGD